MNLRYWYTAKLGPIQYPFALGEIDDKASNDATAFLSVGSIRPLFGNDLPFWWGNLRYWYAVALGQIQYLFLVGK